MIGEPRECRECGKKTSRYHPGLCVPCNAIVPDTAVALDPHRKFVDDGHRFRLVVTGEGVDVEIICPHPHHDVPEDARCAWYRPKGHGPYWCGLQLELREEGAGALLWDWPSRIDLAEPIPVTGDVAFEWSVTHYEDDAPEVMWRPVVG